MNVNSGGPHILLFERDQQLTTLLSGELALAGYEVHTARTAVEVFDAIARFPVKLVMVNLAQAQAGRREFWVALDAQRRGRGVQVFTFRCTNLAGYGPEDPDERVDTVMTDLEVDGTPGVMRLVDAVRERIPGAVPPSSNLPLRQASPAASYAQGIPLEQSSVRPAEMHAQPLAAPVYPPAPPPTVPSMVNAQPLQGTLRPQPPQEMYVPAPPLRSVEPPRSGHSTFTDKIRAVIYPGGRSVSSNNASSQAQHAVPYQNSDVQPRPQASQRFADADYSINAGRESMIYQPSANSGVSAPSYPTHSNGAGAGTRPINEESGLDQLSRMLRENQSTLQNEPVNGNIQNGASSYAAPGLTIDPQEMREFRSQILQAARQDEAYERSMLSQPRSAEMSTQLRASPMHDRPFEHEAEYRRANSAPLQQNFASQPRPAVSMQQPTQTMPPVQPGQPPSAQGYPPAQASPIQSYQAQPVQASPAQNYQAQPLQASPIQSYQAQPLQASPVQSYQVQPVQTTVEQNHQSQQIQAVSAQNYQSPPGYVPPMDNRSFSSGASSQAQAGAASSIREALPEMPMSAANSSQVRAAASLQEASPDMATQPRQVTGPLSNDRDITLSEQVQAHLQQTLARRPEIRTSDDMLLDIVKSLPPMAPAPQPPQTQVLNGRATRSLGSVLLEGHLVPQERLQVAQHVQRMLRGVDLNYQLGEILLMFKLLTPDQLLAASLVSYGMISTVQISALGRIRQELHAMGLEYDLESLVILFRILTPEQMREVRASWSS
ncbi:MAG TPA: hypothetical protein VFV38_04050 [Ktedonobacteraceae bacterium]|nr:hypothetical protein [Ktedonobacteraceae bacterium]